jgi:hypothetical protein
MRYVAELWQKTKGLEGGDWGEIPSPIGSSFADGWKAMDLTRFWLGQTNVMIALSDWPGTAACAAGGCRLGQFGWEVVPNRFPRRRTS